MRSMKSLLLVNLIITAAVHMAFSSPCPQGSQHGQPAAGSMTTPAPGNAFTNYIKNGGKPKEDVRRGDPNLLNTLYKSKTPLGNAEVYIVLALLIGFLTVVIGCWLSDNCWSSEPEEHPVTIA